MRHRNDESLPNCKAVHTGCLAALLLTLLSPLPLAAQTPSGATVRPGQTSLTLPAGGGIYLYAMGTGGGRPSANFAEGPYAQVVDAAGYIVAGLAITASPNNSFSTETDYHTVGGISVSGFKTVRPYYGSSGIAGAKSAAVHFVLDSPAVVVVTGIAGGETNLQLGGVPGLQVDAQAANQSGVIPIVIAHTTLGPGEYDVSEQTSGNRSQNRAHMGDLIGVFVFMGGPGPVVPPPPRTVPIITSVSPIAPQPAQTILIKGEGFGTVAPYVNSNSPYLAINDMTAQMEAGHAGNAVTLSVARWTDTEIEVTGFSGAYGMGTWTLNTGDKITVRVWNAQTGAGPATYDLIVGGNAVYSPRRLQVPNPEARFVHPLPMKLGFRSAPPPIFNGAYAVYNLRLGNLSTSLRVAVSNVDLSNGTCTETAAFGEPLSDRSTTRTVNFDEVPFWGLKPSDLDQVRMGRPPRGVPAGMVQVRPNMTVSVPAGTFTSEQLVGPDGASWFDARSGVAIRAMGPLHGFFGDLGVANAGNGIMELTSTNIPMSSATSPMLLYGAAIGLAVLALGLITYMFTRGGKGRVVQQGARPEAVQDVRESMAPRPEQAAAPPVVGGGASSTPAITSDALDKLAKPKCLLDAGLITAEEFQEQKAKLLGQPR